MIQTDSRRMIRGECDDIVILTPLPLAIRTEEEARQYFEQFEIYRPVPGEYENQMHTEQYKLFQRGGRWMAYHRIGFD